MNADSPDDLADRETVRSIDVPPRNVPSDAPRDLLAADASPPAPPPTAAAHGSPAWSAWQRVAFRFACVYFVLWSFPRPISSILQTLAGAIAWLKTTIAGDAQDSFLLDAPFRWPGKWARELGHFETWREDLTTWLDQQGLAPYEVIHQRTGSGDTGHDVALLLVTLAAAAVLTAMWSVGAAALRRAGQPPARSCGHPRLGRWLHLVVRFELAFTMLGYGFAKFYGGQFGELSLTRLTQEIGDTWPMTMVGTFMQASKPYELFSGGAEVLGGLLLFHPRTALLGALVTIGVMTNVCALNWLCGVPVKLYSAHLLLFAIALLAPYARSLWALFVRNAPTRPVDLRVPAPRWLRWPLRIGGWGWVLTTLFLTHMNGITPKPWMKGREKPALYGLWLVDTMLVDGTEVPTSDASRWRFLAIDRGKVAWAREQTGKQLYFDFVYDPARSTADAKQRSGDKSQPSMPWTCELGTTTVPCDPPLLLRNEDRGKQVDGERRTLVIKGQWGDKQLELRTHEKVFRLETGFRLRQELPDFW